MDDVRREIWEKKKPDRGRPEISGTEAGIFPGGCEDRGRKADRGKEKHVRGSKCLSFFMQKMWLVDLQRGRAGVK